MTKRAPETVWDLEPNDIPAAVEFIRRKQAEGTWSNDHARVALRLQDDPRALLKALVDANERLGKPGEALKRNAG